MTTLTAAVFTAVLVPLCGTGIASTEAETDTDQCLAPYFEIRSGESAIEAFPLRKTETRVTIAGVIAEVTVRQTYANTGSATIEARYLFPASTRAAVHGMEMKIGERQVVAKIEERVKAKATFLWRGAEGAAEPS